jgi:hypothetical protein
VSDSIENDLVRALAVVEGASIPDDLRPVAFASAFWGARETAAPPRGVVPGSIGVRGVQGIEPVEEAGKEGTGLRGIAAKLGASEADVEFVYELEDKKLNLRVPPSRLAPVLRDAMTQIIYLVAAGRQAADLDDKSASGDIKAVCVECGKVDSNFSRVLAALHGEGMIVGGSGRSRTVRVNADGFERAGKIIEQLRISND